MVVSALLREWDLPELLEPFSGVDFTTLLGVSGDFLEKLIPDINLRWRFVSKRNAFKSTLTAVDPAVPSTSTSSECNSRPGSALSSVSLQDTSWVESTSPTTPAPTQVSVPTHKRRSSNDEPAGHISKRQQVDVDSYVEKVTILVTSLSNVNDIQLEDVLKSSVCGRWILRTYEENNCLSDEARTDFVDILVAELMNITISPSQEEYASLTQKILDIFPNETDEVYYEPPLKSGSHQKLARGKLFDKFRSKKARYGLCTGRGSKKQSDTPDLSTISDLALSEEAAISVDFLSKWQEPLEEVNRHWIGAAPHRLHWLKGHDNCDKVAEYLALWPHLKHPDNGPKLIDIDFELSTVGKDKADKLLLKWDNFIKRFKVIVSKRKITSKQDSEGKEILSLLKRKDINDFELETLLLELLPSILSANRFVVIGEGVNSSKHKPSVVEVRSAFIVRVNAAGDLNTKICQLRERMAKVGGALQPFISVVGERPSFTSIYVCLDSHLYKVKSIKEAVDLCFKTFFALHCDPPSESEHLWQFVQRYFFDIKIAKKSNITAVTTFITSLDACN
ncbi:uncharacterized protein LOC127750193 [Frankliniella occidentalis]|uniref:Uncharacterized protein LOC127750193 n=1 Tax=Frankliniella occidentalis TaxID=133901 RepID=A0A9C6U480_FRAOC|nr:uncharacterized protein LOC127750193 [Frankliniella occidentalis]